MHEGSQSQRYGCLDFDPLRQLMGKPCSTSTWVRGIRPQRKVMSQSPQVLMMSYVSNVVLVAAACLHEGNGGGKGRGRKDRWGRGYVWCITWTYSSYNNLFPVPSLVSWSFRFTVTMRDDFFTRFSQNKGCTGFYCSNERSLEVKHVNLGNIEQS